MDISLITIVNNENLYIELKENVEKQEGVDYELIPVMNINNESYSSARKALADGAQKAQGRYLMFLHSDVRFTQKNQLRSILYGLDEIGDFGVVGVAGCPESLVDGKRVILSNIVHGKNKVSAGKHIYGAEKVQTVDECLFIQTKKYFDKVGFSSKSGWHLYAVEQCLRAEADGRNNYVIPVELWHISDGRSLDPKYVLQLIDLRKEYSKKYDYIVTTVKLWKTKGILSEIYVRYYYIKQVIKKKIQS